MRPVLTDSQWQRIAPLLPSAAGHSGRPYSSDHRTTVEGILWIARTGAPWRDLPERFGKWNTVYQRFRRWTRSGVFDRIFTEIADSDADLDVAMIDGTFVKVHQHAAGAPKEGALPANPAAPKQLAPAEEGEPPSSSRSPTETAGSRDSHFDPGTSTKVIVSPISWRPPLAVSASCSPTGPTIATPTEPS